LAPDDFVIICSEIAAFGQTCQLTAVSFMTVPSAMSSDATKTSSVSSLGAACTITGAGVDWKELKKK